MVRKYCIVPQCHNSTIKTPNKLFFYVPEDSKMRKKWMTAVKRMDSIGPKTKAHCCEDHFDVENDMENYVKYKLVGGKLKLKEGVVPHKFACQKQKNEKPERSVVKILNIAKMITSSSECIASTSHDVEEIYIVDSIPQVQDIVNDPLKFVTRDENLNSTEKENLKMKHKNIQVNLKNKVCHKSTQTDNKSFHLRSMDKKRSKIKKLNHLEVKPSTSSFEESLISTNTNTNSYCDVLDETDITSPVNKVSKRGSRGKRRKREF